MGDLTLLLCARPWVSEREKRVQRLKTVWSEVILLLPDQIPICFTILNWTSKLPDGDDDDDDDVGDDDDDDYDVDQ